MSSPALAIRNVSQRYGKRTVFDHLSLEIPRGQTFALLGRNGAGKTTLIRTLLGLMPPADGSVEVLGLNPSRQPIEVRSKIGYLAEDQAMYGWMTTEEIANFLAPFYPTWDHALAKHFFERFEVPPRTKIKHLSKGHNIRLGLALALAHRPELMILDDPALGLDPITRKQFNRDVIEHLQAQGRTVLYSSHLLYEVEPVADAIAILDQGKFVRVGSTESVQREVKRVVLASEDLGLLERPEQLLDLRREGSQVAVTLDDAESWIPTLDLAGVAHTIEDLGLDDIFEAYVIGQKENWPGRSAALSAVVA